jgi:hypothetical protein
MNPPERKKTVHTKPGKTVVDIFDIFSLFSSVSISGRQVSGEFVQLISFYFKKKNCAVHQHIGMLYLVITNM